MGVIVPEGFALGNIVISRTGRANPYTCTIGLSSGTLTDPQDFADALDAAVTTLNSWFPTGGEGGWSSVYAYEGVNISYMTPSGPIVAAAGSRAQGTNVLSPLPPNCSLLYRKRTPFGGRHGRGRMFFPPIYIAESNVDSNGTIDGAQISPLQARATAFIAACATNSITPVLLHSEVNPLPYEITSMTIETLIATQRRRMRS